MENNFALIEVTPDGNGVKDVERLMAVSKFKESLKSYCMDKFNKEVTTEFDSLGNPKPFSWDAFYKIEPTKIEIV